jgi:hypothetical protein
MPAIKNDRRGRRSAQTAACHKCRFWVISETSEAVEVGLCHRAAPQQSGWPATSAIEWCGEFKTATAQWIRVAFSFAQLVLAMLVTAMLFGTGFRQMFG